MHGTVFGCADLRFGMLGQEPGYEGRVVSFEPLSEAFARLEIEASRDARWDVVCTGLGTSTEQKTIHVAKNSESSTFLETCNRHAEAYPQSIFVGSEVVTIERLDNLFPEYYETAIMYIS